MPPVKRTQIIQFYEIESAEKLSLIILSFLTENFLSDESFECCYKLATSVPDSALWCIQASPIYFNKVMLSEFVFFF